MTTLTNTNEKEFNNNVFDISESAKKMNSTIALGQVRELSEKYPDVAFSIYFSNNGEKCKGIKFYNSIGEARFYADKANGYVYLNGKEI